jgi:hypothetical protein
LEVFPCAIHFSYSEKLRKETFARPLLANPSLNLLTPLEILLKIAKELSTAYKPYSIKGTLSFFV